MGRSHSVLPEEAGQVIFNDPLDLGTEIIEGEECYLNLGATRQGRVLLVVTTWREDRVRVVTAFEPIKRLIQFYYQEQRGDRFMAKKQPPFKTETQEAEWWAKNQNLIADRLEQAKTAGKLGKGTVARLARKRASQAGASPTITIRLRRMTSREPEPSPRRRDCGTRRISKCCCTKL